MTGAVFATQQIRQRRQLYLNVIVLPVWIHVDNAWGKYQVSVNACQRPGIGIKGSGIGGKILIRAKLEWVYKDGNNNGRMLLARLLHLSQVTIVQVAHSGYQSDGLRVLLVLPAQLGDGSAGVYYAVDGFHLERQDQVLI